jgi:hypothetical protein
MADKKAPRNRKIPAQTAETALAERDNEPDTPFVDGKPTTKARSAVELRLRHASWAEIAETLDYATPNAAKDAVMKAIAYLAGGPETYIALQQQIGMELDLVLRSLAPKAMARTMKVPDPREVGVPEEQRQQITVDNPDHLTYVREYRATLREKIDLFGLAAPKRIQIDTPGSKELDDLVSAVVVAHRGELPPEGNPFDMELDADGVYVQVDGAA